MAHLLRLPNLIHTLLKTRDKAIAASLRTFWCIFMLRCLLWRVHCTVLYIECISVDQDLCRMRNDLDG